MRLSRLLAICAAAMTLPGTVMGREGSEAFRDCPVCPEMVVVPAGRFTMGSPEEEIERSADEGPRHEVRIAYRFALGRYEVTRSELEAYVDDAGVELQGCRVLTGAKWEADDTRSWRDPGFAQSASHPAVCVSWEDAKGYVDWLGRKTGEAYRLPSEAEWEYAGRAGTTGARFWGDDPTQACLYANVADRSTRDRYPQIRNLHACEDGHAHTAPAGSFRPNPFGLHDMLGNVWEWVEDCWGESYLGAPADGRASLAGDCDRRVVRGGSWGLAPEGVRSARRNWFDVPNRSSVLGLRVARTLAEEEGKGE
jgi:formylglycine-generating enzyme required for sulfatase activity